MSERQRIFLATGNEHKVGEFQALALESALAVVFERPPRMPFVEEDTGTFFGNARKKARALRTTLGEDAWALADDSGLCVDHLNGGPGVESAYFAGPEGNAAANLRKLVRVMEGVPAGRRGAHFACTLVLLKGASDEEYSFQGQSPGTLLDTPAGGSGFGYDPLFVPAGESLSFAELPASVKNALSHRGRAFAQFARWFKAR